MIDLYPDLRRATRDSAAPFPDALSPATADDFFGRLSLEHAC